ncbi:MAG: hypothetical protein E6Q88_08715 [Lysobacteraceae bacterium]|nr:MAG: hypothetical protein E6Q88_08715 [Xanthomonadaceae bacterium]
MSAFPGQYSRFNPVVPPRKFLLSVLVWMSAIVASPTYAQCNTQNLAPTGTATASTTYPGYSPARVNDGNISTALGGATSWANDRFGTAILDINLTAPAPISGIALYTTLGYEVRDYNVLLRVNGLWQTVSQIRGNTAALRNIAFAPQVADAVRIQGISGPAIQPGYIRVNELQICRSAQVTTTLNGRVRLFHPRNNNPGLANVTVDLGGGLVATTNAAGNYQIANVPAGAYTIRATRAGLTCGSAQFQRDRYTVQLNGGTFTAIDILCYNRNPIVYVTGWTDTLARFIPVSGMLRDEGYLDVDGRVQTSIAYTPPLLVNAVGLRAAVEEARYLTGQPQAILFAHSMGGLVSRSYVESFLYRNDVSQVFTFGSPHRGTPAITWLACLPNQPAVCEMSKPNMLLFNVTHGQRPGVRYHAIGGDAPMWETRRVCFRIFGIRICFNVPWPNFNFRNGFGWATGLLIPLPDDALIQTHSSTGMPGLLDRMVTQEVHIRPALGHRDYYDWNGNNWSQQAYQNCAHPVLVAMSRINCGTVSFWPVFGFYMRAQQAAGSGRLPLQTTQSGEFAQRSRTVNTAFAPLQTIEREVLVDGSPTIFTAEWGEGDARLTLIDPSGQVFDPEYAASILDGEPVAGEPISDRFEPEMVLYQATGTSASYQFPAPRPGRWRMIVQGGDTISPKNGRLETNVVFDSGLGMDFQNEFPFFLAGSKAEIRLLPTSTVFSAQAEAEIVRFDGVVDTVQLTRQLDDSYRGVYPVPDAAGIAEVRWFVSGTTATGQPFERAGSDAVQISRRNLTVTGVSVETPVPRPGEPQRYMALEIPVDIESAYSGTAMVAADLVDGEGNVVANAALAHDARIGPNRVTLRFEGDDLFANRRNGPYRLTNLITIDQREAALLSDWLQDQLVTNAYDYRQFGPSQPTACGAENLLLGGSASATSSYYGYSPWHTIDGDRNTALGPSYSWSNARETDTVPALPASLQITPATTIVADQILVYSTADWEIRDYDLEYFDGMQWNLIEQVRGNLQTVREHRIPPTGIAGLRVVGHSGPDHQTVHVRVNEIEARRCSSAPTYATGFSDSLQKYLGYAK